MSESPRSEMCRATLAVMFMTVLTLAIGVFCFLAAARLLQDSVWSPMARDLILPKAFFLCWIAKRRVQFQKLLCLCMTSFMAVCALMRPRGPPPSSSDTTTPRLPICLGGPLQAPFLRGGRAVRGPSPRGRARTSWPGDRVEQIWAAHRRANDREPLNEEIWERLVASVHDALEFPQQGMLSGERMLRKLMPAQSASRLASSSSELLSALNSARRFLWNATLSSAM